jgi:hypothetical protein
VKELFTDHRFTSKAADLIVKCNAIVEGYLAQGLRLTLRQLYYQCVTRNYFPNVERS